MTSRALTPTLIICAAAALAGGIALARPGTTATTDAEPATVTTAAAAAPGNGNGYGNGNGRKAPATTAPRSNGNPAAKGGAAGAAPTLTISDFAFGSPLTVSPGAKVPVRNSDSASHTVTGSGFDSGTVKGGATGAVTAPSKPGTYEFTCEIHPSMTGSMTVKS